MGTWLNKTLAANWPFLSRNVLRAAVIVLVVTVSLGLYKSSASVAWELGSLLATLLLCGFTYLDILHYGKHEIWHVLDARFSARLERSMRAVIACLAISCLFAMGLFKDYFQEDYVRVHSFVIYLGSYFAWRVDLAIANAHVNPARFKDNRKLWPLLGPLERCPDQFTLKVLELVKSQPTEVEAGLRDQLEALEKERDDAAKLLDLVDKPACYAYWAVLITVLVEATPKSAVELKGFLGGAVAVGLVIANRVHWEVRRQSGVLG